jgi:hypothetical protein
LLLISSCFADTSSNSTPTRSDALAPGDRVILNSDAPIFTSSDANGNKTRLCAPYRSQFEVVKAPTTTKTTPPTQASDDSTTTTTTQTLATATILRAGPSVIGGFLKRSGNSRACQNQPQQAAASNGSTTTTTTDNTIQPVREHESYQFAPSDLDNYSYSRYGYTYGVLVVPNKVFVSNREFVSSSSVLPYVGFGGWAPGATGALILAAGVGTAPASTQSTSSTPTGTTATPSTSNNSPGTKATFSVATGAVWSFGGGTFKGGFVIGVDTVASHIGYKYQGKPWIGLTLGAGTN